jgi:hypothetical protein
LAVGSIGEQESRAADQGAGDGDALLFCRGQQAGAQPAVETDASGEFRPPAPDARHPPMIEADRQQDVVDDAEFGDELKILEHEADAVAPPMIALRLARSGEILLALPDRAGLRPRQTGTR